MKIDLKNSANRICEVFVLPLLLLYWISSQLFSKEKVFPGWSQLMSLVPGMSGVYLRRAFYKWIFENVGKDVWISFGTVFSHASVNLGNHVYLGVGCMVGDVEIGDDVLIGSNVSIINGNQQHGIDRLDIPVRNQVGVFPRVVIGKDSWIGDRSTIMFHVGQHCVVGAGSVVTKRVEDYQVVVGNPAKPIARRDD